jgi:hypothetical protein
MSRCEYKAEKKNFSNKGEKSYDLETCSEERSFEAQNVWNKNENGHYFDLSLYLYT